MANDGNVDVAQGSKTLFEFLHPNPDKVVIGKLPENDANMTGMDRLKRMFSLDQYGEQSKEIVVITQTFCMTTFCGGIIGAIVHSRNEFVNFLENNQATKFHDHLDAKRALQRKMTLAFGKGAWQWGSRVGFFCTTFTSLLTAVSIYRGKESIIEYLVAGGVTGALWRMNLGLKGAIAGGVAGGVLGGIGGAASLLVLKLGGTSMDEIRSFSKHLKDARSAAIRKKHMISSTSMEDVPIPFDDDDSLYKELKVDDEEEKVQKTQQE